MCMPTACTFNVFTFSPLFFTLSVPFNFLWLHMEHDFCQHISMLLYNKSGTTFTKPLHNAGMCFSTHFVPNARLPFSCIFSPSSPTIKTCEDRQSAEFNGMETFVSGIQMSFPNRMCSSSLKKTGRKSK